MSDKCIKVKTTNISPLKCVGGTVQRISELLLSHTRASPAVLTSGLHLWHKCLWALITFKAQKMHESSMHLCVVSCRKLLRKMSRCHRTWETEHTHLHTERKKRKESDPINIWDLKLLTGELVLKSHLHIKNQYPDQWVQKWAPGHPVVWKDRPSVAQDLLA